MKNFEKFIEVDTQLFRKDSVFYVYNDNLWITYILLDNRPERFLELQDNNKEKYNFIVECLNQESIRKQNIEFVQEYFRIYPDAVIDKDWKDWKNLLIEYMDENFWQSSCLEALNFKQSKDIYEWVMENFTMWGKNI